MNATATPLPRVRTTASARQIVRQAYIEGNGALRVLAGQHGIPLSTLQRWSAKEHWPDLRKEHELVRLGKLCPSQAPSVLMPPLPEAHDGMDAMERRRAMCLGVVEDEIRLLRERQKEAKGTDEQFAVSRLLGEHAERLLRMSGLIPRPLAQKPKRPAPMSFEPLDD